MKIGSPNNIDVLLHYHVSSQPHERIDAPAVKEATLKLLQVGAIEGSEVEPNVYTTTALGRAWVKAIGNTPIPTEAFIDEMGRVIE